MKTRILGTTLALALLALTTPLHAGPVSSWIVSVPTSSFGPGAVVDFQFNDNNGNADANNTATIRNLNLHGGSLGAPNPFGGPFGGVSGSLSSTLTLTDSGAGGFNDFNQAFNPGSSLSFRLDLTTNVSAAEAAGFPDAFFFTIQNAAGTVVSVLEFDINGPNPIPITPALGSTPGAPLITAVPVPEPGTLGVFGGMLAVGAAGYVWHRRRLPALVPR
jgi:hypothetical protein